MFSKVIDNIPSIKNKKFNKINYLEKFNNLDKDIKIENFDDLLESDGNIDEHHSHIELPDEEIEVIVDQEENEFGEKYFAMLTGKSKEKTPQVPKLENIQNIENDENKKNKKFKLDTLTTIYIGSISVVALYIAYRAIRKTI